MNQYEVAAVITDQFPQVHQDFRHLAILGNVYESMNVLVALTREMIAKHQFRHVKCCMKLAGDIYDRGNTIVKGAVENVFVYSFSLMQVSCNKVEWRIVQSLIPAPLFLIFIEQVNCIAS